MIWKCTISLNYGSVSDWSLIKVALVDILDIFILFNPTFLEVYSIQWMYLHIWRISYNLTITQKLWVSALKKYDSFANIAECDIPVPGIPGPGNFAPFWMVPVPVPEKFGPGKKYRSRYRKKFWVPSHSVRQLLTFHILGNNGNNSHWTRDNLQQMFTTISKCLIFYIIFLRSVCHYFTVGNSPKTLSISNSNLFNFSATFLTIAQKCELRDDFLILAKIHRQLFGKLVSVKMGFWWTSQRRWPKTFTELQVATTVWLK